jgi:hydroxylamine reductase
VFCYQCEQTTKGTYSDQFFSYEVAGLEGVTKIENNDFTPIIEKALHLPSANIDSDQKLVTGYHHETVIGLAPEIISLLAKNV